MAHIKAGFVWVWTYTNQMQGYQAVRPARLIETLLYNLFGRAPRP